MRPLTDEAQVTGIPVSNGVVDLSVVCVDKRACLVPLDIAFGPSLWAIYISNLTGYRVLTTFPHLQQTAQQT